MAKISSPYAFPEMKFVSFYTGGSLLTESYAVQNETFLQGSYVDAGDEIEYL